MICQMMELEEEAEAQIQILVVLHLLVASHILKALNQVTVGLKRLVMTAIG